MCMVKVCKRQTLPLPPAKGEKLNTFLMGLGKSFKRKPWVLQQLSLQSSRDENCSPT